MLVALLFVENKKEDKRERNREKYRDGYVVNHIDSNKLNNYYKNLEWITQRENSEHGVGKQVHQIDPKTNKIINTFKTITIAYEHFGKRCNSHISRCCNGLEQKALGYKWKYVD